MRALVVAGHARASAVRRSLVPGTGPRGARAGTGRPGVRVGSGHETRPDVASVGVGKIN